MPEVITPKAARIRELVKTDFVKVDSSEVQDIMYWAMKNKNTVDPDTVKLLDAANTFTQSYSTWQTEQGANGVDLA